MFKTWREYFKYSFLMEETLNTDKTYIILEAPHGVAPLSSMLADCYYKVMWPESKIYCLAASMHFSFPLWRHFITWLGGVPATPANFNRMLTHGSVGVVVGGVAEMYMQDPHKERIKLLDRKGFVRVAVEQGISGGIVPAYNFGNTQVYDILPHSAASLARWLRMAVGLLVGRWGLPIPCQVTLFHVSGCSIPVPHIDPVADPEAFQKAVDELHAQVVAAMQDLYDRHKAKYGWENRPLVIE
eukprot:gene11003-11157_t